MFAKRLLQITLILAILLTSFAIPRSASASGPCGSTYIVQPGDWLSRIANRCGVSLSALYAANPGVEYQRYIYPGQVLDLSVRDQIMVSRMEKFLIFFGIQV